MTPPGPSTRVSANARPSAGVGAFFFFRKLYRLAFGAYGLRLVQESKVQGSNDTSYGYRCEQSRKSSLILCKMSTVRVPTYDVGYKCVHPNICSPNTANSSCSAKNVWVWSERPAERASRLPNVTRAQLSRRPTGTDSECRSNISTIP
ncbi:hypothetical protein V9T40_000199 [Parthenolecanium corni]|uniref:Uncharacterized protein n=1 Tax=Parthenolecanium corni TaxID=536013 RepID=A0AAN9T9D9_9HEMI